MPDPISILMVEDSPLDAEMSLQVLSQDGIEHAARRVETKADFERELIDCAPDIILSDFSLPEFDGVSALKIAHERCPDIPFIFVSGAIGEEVAINSMKNGALDYVLKNRLQLLPPAFRRALRIADERRERKRAQEALGKSEERLRLAVSTARLGTWEINFTNGSIEVSDIFREMFGIGADEEISLSELRQRIHPHDLPAVEEQLRLALRDGGSHQAEFRIYLPDQSLHWISAHGQAVRDSEREISRLVGVTVDTTARKEVEESLAKQAHELSTLNADLRQFAFAASHDLQEPLRMVTVYTQLIAKRYGTIDDDTATFFEFIQTGTDRMAALLRDLLQYLQLQTRERHYAHTDMNGVLQRVLQILNIATLEAGATVTSDPLPQITGDKSQMEQVLQNLIGNALKYRGTAPPVIHISAGAENGNWVFRVRDNGIGFDPRFADQIFGLFKRLNPKDYQGTGLGLAICRRIVEHHGGRIWAESEPGEGSVFSFSLPMDAVVDGTGSNRWNREAVQKEFA